MNQNIKFFLWFVLLVFVFCFWGCSTNQKNEASKEIKPIMKIKVLVEKNDGSKLEINDFHRNIVSHSYSSRVYADEPAVVETPVDYIDLWYSGPQMPYGVTVPFEIVKSIVFEMRKEDDWRINPYLLAKIELGNGSFIQGASGGFFEGETSLGKIFLRIEDFEFESKGVKQISFEHDVKAAYEAFPWGKKTIIIHLLNGESKVIENAAFVHAKRNRNGCWVEEEPGYAMDFEIKGAPLKVLWDKVCSISPTSMDQKYNREDRLSLTGNDGVITQGYCPNYIGVVDTIRGTLKIGKSFKLWVNISLGSPGKPLFTKIEFR